MSYLELLKLAAPETIVVITALIVLGVDLFALRDLEPSLRRLLAVMLSSIGCVVAIVWMFVLPEDVHFLQGMLVVDSITQLVKAALLVLTVLTLLISVEADFTVHSGEYCALVLLAAVGTMFLVSSEDILMIFISLELTSLSLYVLTAFNKRSLKSSEAALKYFLFGGIAAAFTLFVLSWLYGIAGSTNLNEIARVVAERAVRAGAPGGGVASQSLDPLLIGAIVMTVVGFGFKVAAAPFHLWAPDAYEGAPTPSAAFIASASKVASFFIFAKVMMLGFAGVEGSADWHRYASGWVPVLALVAALSMVVGNLAALAQSSVRRLLAYSAIAHAGYMLLGILSGKQSMASLLYYVITYGLTTLGAFGVVSMVQGRGGGDKLSDFAGLSRRAPVLSFCMLIFMLSLAGIPPLAGFFGKFYLFSSALGLSSPDLNLVWLVMLALAASAVSLYYYLQVLKQIYVREPASNGEKSRLPFFGQLVIVLVAAAVVVLGCAPNLLLGRLTSALQLAGL